MNKTRWLNEKETDTWLALWAVSSWMPTRLDEQLKADSEMNLHDYFTLAQVSLADEGRLTMTELACRTQMSPSRLSHVVGRLEKRNLMQRAPDQEDRRTNIASITPQGWEFLDSAAPGHVERVREIVFDALTAEEAEQLGALLHKILVKLNPPTLPRA